MKNNNSKHVHGAFHARYCPGYFIEIITSFHDHSNPMRVSLSIHIRCVQGSTKRLSNLPKDTQLGPD